MGNQNQAGALVDNVAYGGQRSSDALVICYIAVLIQGNIKIHTCNHTFSLQIDIGYGHFVHHTHKNNSF